MYGWSYTLPMRWQEAASTMRMISTDSATAQQISRSWGVLAEGVHPTVTGTGTTRVRTKGEENDGNTDEPARGRAK